MSMMSFAQNTNRSCILDIPHRCGYRGKEKGFYFLTLREFPDTPGTHIYV